MRPKWNSAKSNRGISNRHREMLKIFGLLIAILISLVAVVSLLTRLPILHIEKVQVHGTQKIQSEAIRTEVIEIIDGAYAYLFPRNHVFFLPRTSIKESLNQRYAGIKMVSLNVIGSDILDIIVEERQPFALWCGHTFSTLTPTDIIPDCYFADESGYIYARAPYISDNEFFKIFGTPVGSDNNTQVNIYVSLDELILHSDTAEGYNLIGEYFLTEELFRNVMKFVTMLHAEGIDPYALEIEEKEAQLHLFGGGILKFRLDQNLNSAFENLVLAKTKKIKEDEIEQRVLQYIDVRFKNKVLFKYE